MSHSPPAAARLSAELERWFQVTRAILVGRAALGLLAVLSVWRAARPQCRVAISGAICHEVLLAVLAADCEPIFCDVDTADGLVPASEWARARSLGADVAIVAHLYGNPARIDDVRLIFPAPDCLIVDDAAQALGSYNQNGLCGSYGDIGLLSFGHSKQISLASGAILVRDTNFALQTEQRLSGIVASFPEPTTELQKMFRLRLEAARERLIAAESPDAGGFADLLHGMEWMLNIPLDPSLNDAILGAIGRYPADAHARREKAVLWRQCLKLTGMVPVGMGPGCVPWRYACRLPGIDWREQAELAAAIRKHGIHVSTWYLPANWFVGQDIGTLPGVERLSREVFQFWLDAEASAEHIAESARVIQRELLQFPRPGAHL